MADPQWTTADGSIIEAPASVVHVAMEIETRYPDLQLGYLNPNHPEAHFADAPWVVYRKNDRAIVLTAFECDNRILERLAITPEKALEIVRLHEQAEKAERQRKAEELRAENRDVLLHAFKNPKTTWTYEGRDGEVHTVSDDPKPQAPKESAKIVDFGGTD